jgi:hypothetical protein
MLITLEDTRKAVKTALSQFKAMQVNDLWEKTDNGYKYILSAHNLISADGAVVFFKLIFWVSEDKQTLTTNKITYLYDLNCEYRTFEFGDMSSLEKMLGNIVSGLKFGENILAVSDLMSDCASHVNKIFYDHDIKKFSVFSFDYQPASSITACKDTVFEFSINVNGYMQMQLRISYNGDWNVSLSELDREETKSLNDLSDIHLFVANAIQKLK